MRCVECGSASVTERPERTAHGYRRFCCRQCGKQFNERSGTLLDPVQYPSDMVALVILWRLRYKLSLRDLPEMFLVRGMVFSHEAIRAWEARFTPALAEDLRGRRRGRVGRSWHVDETCLKMGGAGATWIAPSTRPARWWTCCSASAATWRRPRCSSTGPGPSRGSRPIGSPRMATTAIRARPGPCWAALCATGPADIRATGWNRTTAASKGVSGPCGASVSKGSRPVLPRSR